MKKRILICEDDLNIIEIMTVMLEEEGYEVKAQDNGKGFLKLVNNFKPNMIFLDIWMPGIGGKELAVLIDKDEKLKKIPVIIISALSEGEIKNIVSEVKATDYLLKPFTIEQILAVIEKHLK